MTLNGIDISHWQSGIDLSAIDYDFMICKATQGTTYTDSCCDGFVQKAKKAGKCWGFYHFISTADVTSQADFFVEQCSGYFGSGIPVLDWEDNNNSATSKLGVSGAKKFLDRVYDKTGVRPLIYMSRSVANAYDWSSVASDYGLWVARYASNNTVSGYNPPSCPSVRSEWTVACFQYTSHGRLSGYSSNLDLDVFYGDSTTWAAYAGASTTSTASSSTTTTTSSTALDVDGSVGPKTVTRWQEAMGTETDGEVSAQVKSDLAYWPALSSSAYTIGTTGSDLIRAWQRRLNSKMSAGLDVDGLAGKNTALWSKKYLNKLGGYGLAVSGTNKYKFDSDAAKALQKALNKGTF